MKILVTGKNGQLGQALQALAEKQSKIEFVFTDSKELDITNSERLKKIFSKLKPDFCINTAAYTAVDKAETEKDTAFAINVTGAKNLAEVCKKHGTTLIHISTDFVFDGSKNTPYTEAETTNPQGVYGLTKRDGEIEIEKAIKEYYIIRTSWVYSEYANNFMKTMIRLSNERNTLNVVNDQVGTPTNANNLAAALVSIILSDKKAYGIYNFSNEGVASWYDFAKEILRVNNISINLKPIPSSAYPTPAKRPPYSVLDKSKIKDTFGIEIKDWKDALQPYKG
ncbi:dTDP-4-dehydrorhamnose reductase [Flavobacterium akiainvivens]|uniref:dTDP-4-dehydrorhamnose reductase n=1 Tax=Flavobacterium akiainvivens TaxID=1202724 RepID=A0A0N0RQS5_9FLAO|nr:dTDP-4-dehydrorhamnose reductase [Flavobacterium akiainvivens]KOS06356.1 dTDP-4-dehydrorhamnose reductase [Flavobacterium akiainvivens]SFQ15321.1 dTDP-4-dehydrorhamnose reductase [Flavobacterium akiainvivens]